MPKSKAVDLPQEVPQAAPEERQEKPPEDTQESPHEEGRESPNATLDPIGEEVNPINFHANSDTTSSVDAEGETLEGLAQEHLAGLESYPGFDATIHAVDKNGIPIRNSKGDYAKKRGRKPGQKTAAVSGAAFTAYSLPNASGQDAPLQGDFLDSQKSAPEKLPVSSEATAKMCANMTFAAGVMVFGDELGKPKDKDEANSIKNAYRDYFDARGTPNLPPELGLVIALGAYAAPRLQHETMREKVARWIDYVKSFFRKPQAPKKVTDNPHHKEAANNGATVMGWAK